MNLWLIITLSVLGTGLLCLLYGFFVEPSWIRTRSFDVDLGEGHPFAGRTLLFFSDLHVGPKSHPRLVRRRLKAVSRHKADAIIFGGDLVEEATPLWDQAFEDDIIRGLASLKAPLGKWAVYGNHDLEAPRCRLWVSRVLEQGGFQILENQALPLPGLPAWAFADGHHGQPQLDESWSESIKKDGACPPFTLFIIHEPDHFPETMAWQGPGLVLAGHSHSGQVTLFGLPLIRPPGAKTRWKGTYPLGDQLDLIVSAGLGTVHIHARFFARPDLLLIRFH